MGLLDGELAEIIGSALVSAGLSKPAVLIKVTPGTRTPGAVTGGTHPTTVSYAAEGIEASLTSLRLSGALITGVTAAIRLLGSTIASGQVPVSGDRISIDGRTYTIAADEGGRLAVTRDPAAASYLCQCKA
jgi:hypothetical protein